MNKIIIKYIKMFLIVSIILYLLLLFYKNNIETSLTFVGKGINENYVLPKNFEEINISFGDNNINGIFLNNNSEKTIFYFHGNGGPINYYFDNIIYIGDLGYNVMSYDYPGYGKSTGYPLEQEVYKYSQKFFDYIKEVKKIKNDDIIVFGHSIGTGVGIDFTYKNKVDKLILISPLSSRYEMSKQQHGFVLQKFLFMENSFNNLEKIKNIQVPTLIIHGTNDRVINYYQGKKIFESSTSEKKYFITLDNFGHNGIIEKYGEVLKVDFLDFLKNGEIKNNKTL